MSTELTYLILTPYTIRKSRTGGIIARLLSRTDLELVAAQIMTPTKEFAEAYADSLDESVGERDKLAASLLHTYVSRNFAPSEEGDAHRIMVLIFKGEDACQKMFDIVGGIFPESNQTDEIISGEKIRDTYADLVYDFENPYKVSYFEPAVLAPPNNKCVIEKLKLIADFAKTQSNIVKQKSIGEQTLVILKPDNWRHPSTKPGNIIDMLSKTGLRIIGCKLYTMSLGEALEFYGPVKGALRKNLAPKMGEKAKGVLEREFDIKLAQNAGDKLTEIVGYSWADDQFSQIVEFMSGVRPETPDDKKPVKCLVLIYEGDDAISKIRAVLGPTDPTKAPGGTVRRDFGSDIMINTAHASDSPESVKREKGVVKIEENRLVEIIEDFIK